MMVMPRIAPAAIANVLVYASGLNSRPDCSPSTKIGRKATVMTSMEEQARADLVRASRMICTRGGRPVGDSLGLAFQVLVGVLDHHDGRVHHHADGQREPAEAHDVGVDAQELHDQDRTPAPPGARKPRRTRCGRGRGRRG